jgi:hypothetical protein
MRTKLKALVAAVAIAGAVGANPAKAAFLENWFLDYNGGGNSLTKISEFLDIVGPSIVSTSVPVAGAFTFTEKGAVSVPSHDGTKFFPEIATHQIAALFDLAGSATLGGTITYTSGTINVWSTPAPLLSTFGGTGGTFGVNDAGLGATLIATFTPVTGSGNLDATGIPNGTQTIAAEATFMAAGYFFAPDGTTDLSTLVALPDPIIFGFATTNASRTLNPDPNVISELDPTPLSFDNCLPGESIFGAPVSGAACTGATGAGDFAIGNNGQFRLITVPEPGVVALLGIALLGLGITSRRKA